MKHVATVAYEDRSQAADTQRYAYLVISRTETLARVTTSRNTTQTGQASSMKDVVKYVMKKGDERRRACSDRRTQTTAPAQHTAPPRARVTPKMTRRRACTQLEIQCTEHDQPEPIRLGDRPPTVIVLDAIESVVVVSRPPAQRHNLQNRRTLPVYSYLIKAPWDATS